MKTLKLGIFGIMFLFVLSGCKKNLHPCDEVDICTDIFTSITVELKFENILLENFGNGETILDETGEKIFSNQLSDILFWLNWQPGDPIHFQILTDNQLEKLSFEGKPVTVKFYDIGGGLIKEEKFVIRHDCCHVEKLSGADIVVF